MTGNEFLEPGMGAYVRYCLAFSIRYFAVLGGLYWLFQVGFRRAWLRHRIQEAFPSATEVHHEIRWSMLNMLATGFSTMLLYWLVRGGYTSLYFGVDEHGWLYFLLSVALGIVSYDLWIYWEHRLLHTPWLFRHVHSIHHVSNPSAFASFARHPAEAWMEHAYFIAFMVLVPIHPLAMTAIVSVFFVFGVVAHLGYELYPSGFTRHPVAQWFNTSTYHNMHHSQVDCNYGNWLNVWDRLMSTNHPAYHDRFDALTARRGMRARGA